MKPDKAHAARLLARQDGLDDGGLQQGQAQQFVDRRVVEQQDTREAVDIKALNAEISRIVVRQAELRTAIDAIVADLEGERA